MAMPTARSGLLRRPIAIAEPLSAAPPITASRTMPRKTGDISSAWPVASAAPTSTSLIHAAPAEAATSVATARPALHVVSPWAPCSSVVARGEELRMGPDHVHEIADVGGEQHEGDAEVQRPARPRAARRPRKRWNAAGIARVITASISMLA